MFVPEVYDGVIRRVVVIQPRDKPDICIVVRINAEIIHKKGQVSVATLHRQVPESPKADVRFVRQVEPAEDIPGPGKVEVIEFDAPVPPVIGIIQAFVFHHSLAIGKVPFNKGAFPNALVKGGDGIVLTIPAFFGLGL